MLYHESSEWQRYEMLRKQRPSAFSKGDLEIIVNHESVDHYYEKSGRRMGVLYESPYHILIVDLVRSITNKEEAKKAEPFLYERLLPTVESGAVVVIPIYNDKFVLLQQFRHAPREKMLAFPRGFGEKGLSDEQNACKEIEEELGTSEINNLHYIGTVTPDSGILGTKAKVFLCNVGIPKYQRGYEEIDSVLFLSKDELMNRIRLGEISDSYTLSALMLYLAT